MPKSEKKRQKRGNFYFKDSRTGYEYARVQVPTGETRINQKGKRVRIYKTIKRRVTNKTHAEQVAAELRADFQKRGRGLLDGRTMTFSQLAEWYKATYCVPPEYRDGARVAGMNSYKNEGWKVDRLVIRFGTRLINKISWDELSEFRRELQQTVSVATANRYLTTLKKIFAKARQRKWIVESPFDQGDTLVHVALEKKRDIFLTAAEEARLVRAARSVERSRIYYLTLALLDTGARPSELFRFHETGAGLKAHFEPPRWVDFFSGGEQHLTLVSKKGRLTKSRVVPVSERLRQALRELWERDCKRGRTKADLIFPETSFGTAWKRVIQKADLPAVRMRDLRHTAASKLDAAGLSKDEVRNLLGHEKDSAETNRYLNANFETVEKARALLDEANAQRGNADLLFSSEAVN